MAEEEEEKYGRCDTHTKEKHTVLTNFVPAFDLSPRGLYQDDIKLHLYLILLLLLPPLPSCRRSEPVLPHIQPPPYSPIALFAPHPLVNISSLLKESHKTQSLLGRSHATNPPAPSFVFQGKVWIDKFKDKKYSLI